METIAGRAGNGPGAGGAGLGSGPRPALLLELRGERHREQINWDVPATSHLSGRAFPSPSFPLFLLPFLSIIFYFPFFFLSSFSLSQF